MNHKSDRNQQSTIFTLFTFLAASSSPEANASSIGPLSSSPATRTKVEINSTRYAFSHCFVVGRLLDYVDEDAFSRGLIAIDVTIEISLLRIPEYLSQIIGSDVS